MCDKSRFNSHLSFMIFLSEYTLSTFRIQSHIVKCLGKLVIIDALCPQFKRKKSDPTKSNPNKRPYNFFIVAFVCIIWNVSPHRAKHLLYFCVGRFYAFTYYVEKSSSATMIFMTKCLLSMPFYDALHWCFSHCLVRCLHFYDTLIEIIDNKKNW